MKTTRWNMTIAALLLSGALHAAESGTAIKGDELKAEPFRDAKTVATRWISLRRTAAGTR